MDDGPEVAPLVVVGAGPHALALVTRLLEANPDPLAEVPWNTMLFRRTGATVKAKYPDGPSGGKIPAHRRVRKAWQAARARQHKKKAAVPRGAEGLRVLDASGDWLARWRRQFDELHISHLRSGLSAHPDPVSRLALQYHISDLPCEQASAATVELFLPRSPEYHGPFLKPTTETFNDFCGGLVHRYGLRGRVEAAHVARLELVPQPDGAPHLVRLHYSAPEPGACRQCAPKADGGADDKGPASKPASILARRVVLALGPGQPNWPDWARCTRPDAECLGDPLPGCYHAADLFAGRAPPPAQWRGKRVIVIGGGVTAAQWALLAVESGAKVTLVARRALQCLEFDIPRAWASHRRAQQLADFWCLELPQRRRLLQATLDGGSLPSALLEQLRETAECSRSLELVEAAEAVAARPAVAPNVGLTLMLDGAGRPRRWRHCTDLVFLATGFATAVDRCPLLNCLCQQAPVELVDGLPPLDENLMWRSDVPVHVMGGAAAMQLGPGALNLLGARSGAERVAAACTCAPE